ncbi:hypothetical protein Tco_0996670, partial [Tanacetum coccineum]
MDLRCGSGGVAERSVYSERVPDYQENDRGGMCISSVMLAQHYIVVLRCSALRQTSGQSPRMRSIHRESSLKDQELQSTSLSQYNVRRKEQAEVNELRAERLARAHDPLALMANSNSPYNYPVFHQDQPSPVTYMKQPQPNNNFNLQPSFNINYMQQPMPNPKDITDLTTTMNMALVLMAKAFKLNYSTPTNNNQRISSNPRNRHIAQPGMNLGQDRKMQMVGGNGGNQFRQYDGQNIRNQNRCNAVQTVGNQNGNVVAARAEGNVIGNNVEQHPATAEETRALYDSLYNNLATKVETVNL